MKTQLIFVSYAGYRGQCRLDLPSFIAKAAGLGYDSVMLAGKRPHLSPLDAHEESLAEVRDALHEHKIECGGIAGYTDLVPSAAAEVPYLEMQIACVESLPECAN